MMNHTGIERLSSRQPTDLLLQNSIRRFLRKRGIEAASAVSLMALTSFSQTYALSLGELNVTSALGQPLRATLQITTGPGEYVGQNCVRLNNPGEGLPAIEGLTLNVSTQLNTSVLSLRGNAPMREPMSEIVLRIDCAGTPQLTRSFLVLLDPPALDAVAPAPVAPTIAQPAPRTVTRSARRAPTAPRSSSRPVTARASLGGPIEAGSRYTVQPGDILSVIAARVSGRPEYSVWPIAQRIFETNPGAFDGRDPDTLRVGATLAIPRLTGQLAVDRAPGLPRRVVADTTAAPVSAPAGNAPTETVDSRPAASAQATGLVGREPVVNKMRYSQSFSSLSLDRLRQRRTGKMMVAPDAVVEAPAAPEPVIATNTPARSATNTAVQRPAAPTPAPRVEVITRPRHWIFSALWLLCGVLVGGLLTMFGMRTWLARQRRAQEAEIARAKRHQARLDESRQTRTDDKPPSIVVHEELPRVDIGGAGVIGGRIETVGSMEEILASGTPTEDTTDVPVVDGISELEEDDDATTFGPALAVDAIETDNDLDFDVFDTPNESDLELLAQDYAQSTGDLSKLEPGLNLKDLASSADLDMEDTMAMMLTPEQLGVAKDSTQIMDGSLDLELPEGSPDDTELSLRALERQVTEELDEELTEAAIKLDADLLNLDYGLPDDSDPTRESESLTVLEADQNLNDDDPTSSIQTRDTEDYYHLEASSIRHIGDLAFESELDDDESKILSFRRQDKSGGAG